MCTELLRKCWQSGEGQHDATSCVLHLLSFTRLMPLTCHGCCISLTYVCEPCGLCIVLRFPQGQQHLVFLMARSSARSSKLRQCWKVEGSLWHCLTLYIPQKITIPVTCGRQTEVFIYWQSETTIYDVCMSFIGIYGKCMLLFSYVLAKGKHFIQLNVEIYALKFWKIQAFLNCVYVLDLPVKMIDIQRFPTHSFPKSSVIL